LHSSTISEAENILQSLTASTMQKKKKRSPQKFIHIVLNSKNCFKIAA